MKKKLFYILDRKFKENKSHYFMQCAMAMTANGIIMLMINSFFHTIIMASFGATAFIVFAWPKSRNSSARRVVGGYILSIATGVLMYHLVIVTSEVLYSPNLQLLFAALTTGLILLLMTITNTEHPPAAGVAFGIVLQGYTFYTLLILVLAVIILSMVKWILRDWLIDLQ